MKDKTTMEQVRIMSIVNAPYQNCYGGLNKNDKPPLNKNDKENNTRENNTRENNNNTPYNPSKREGADTPGVSEEFALALNAFEEHRKKLRKPMTDYAKKLLLNKLQKLAKTEQEQIAIINQSIENGWQGIFPLGGERKQKQAKQSAADMAEDVIRMMDERGMLDDTRGANENDTNAGGVPSWFSE
jgi:hypothetical protein